MEPDNNEVGADNNEVEADEASSNDEFIEVWYDAAYQDPYEPLGGLDKGKGKAFHEVLADLRKGKGKAKGKGNIEETSALPSSSSSSALPSALGGPAEGKGKASGGPAELIEVWHDVGPAYEDLYEALGGPAEGKGKASGGTAEGKGKSKAKGAKGVITGKGPAQAKGKGKAKGQGSVVPAHWICVGGSKNGKSKGKNKDK